MKLVTETARRIERNKATLYAAQYASEAYNVPVSRDIAIVSLERYGIYDPSEAEISSVCAYAPDMDAARAIVFDYKLTARTSIP